MSDDFLIVHSITFPLGPRRNLVNQTLLVPTVVVASVGVPLVTALVRRSVGSRVRAAVATAMPATAVVRPSRVCRRRE